jgi:hypothetical protein
MAGNKRKLSDSAFRSPGFRLVEQYRDEVSGLDTTISLMSDDFDLRGKLLQHFSWHC